MILGIKHDDGGGSGVASPCIDVCRMDGQFCIGCYRRLDEIARWSKADDDEKRLILAAVAERRGVLDPDRERGRNRKA